MNVMLETLVIEQGTALAGAFALLSAFMVFFLILALGLYIYSSLAFMALADKTKKKPSWIAWIPFVGKPLIASRIAKMHWWPILLLLLGFLPAIGSIASIVFIVFYFIWMWKTFEAVGKPGWWILLVLIPILGWVLYFVFLGIAAWSDD